MEKPDRRVATRFRTFISAEYRGNGGHRRGSVFNMGSDGLFIRTAEPLSPGSFLSVAVKLPDSGDPVRLEGQIVWVNLVDTEEMPAGMGIRLVRVQSSDRSRLQHFLRTID